MGFEIIFKFHEKKEHGGYDTENVKELKKDIGKPTDDISIDKLARVVLAQLARRDIWVVDVDIYEYTKKKVSYNETKGGVVIKHKKFNLDHGDIISEDEIEVEKAPQLAIQITSAAKNGQIAKLPAALFDKPIRYEYFDPQFPELISAAKKRGYFFTLGKKYPIFHEKPDPRGVHFGMIYHTEDDVGQRQVLNSLHFQPEVKALERGFNPEEDLLSVKQPSNNLGMTMPEIKTFGI